MKILHKSSVPRVFMFFSVLLLAFALAPAASTGPQPEVACPSCDDHSVCTIDSCDSTTGFCRHDPVVCDDANPCTDDSCNATSGCRFVARPVGTACDDANPCSAGDICTGTPRVCTGSLLAPGTPCDDSNACTHSDSCTAEGQCLGTQLSPGSACDDQNACTSADTCVESPAGSGNVTCEGTLQLCDDGDPCTQDTCDPASGTCGAAPRNCDDGNVCTLDACNVAAGGCVHTAQSGSCEDGIFCSVGDFCFSGNCRGSATRDCSDHLSCTDDRCIESPPHCENTPDNSLCPPSTACFNNSCQTFGPAPSGCVSVPLTGNPCSDNNPCTAGDVCSNGTCLSGTPLNCDDGNACTADSCTGTTCAHTDITASCDDGNACTIDSCNPATGCVHQPATGGQVTCGVGACQRTVDACVNGVPQTCVPGTPAEEVCNGLDDDCDGSVDGGCTFTVDCVANPSTLNLSSQGIMVSITCQFPISGSAASQVYVSRLDSADTSSDDVILPDPSTLPCPDPVLGTLYERGISENMAIREASDPSVTFKFNLPSDGNCSTLDGNRQDFAARLTAIPNNTSATVCISGTLDGKKFEGCVLMLVLNKGPR